MPPIEFFVPWKVEPKQSARHRIANKGGKPFIASYQSSRIVQNERELVGLMAAHVPSQPILGPVRVSFRFQYPWRTTDSKKQRAKQSAPKTTKPDLTQLVKQIEDCMQTAGFFTNDAQIAEYSQVTKVWTDRPGVQIRLEEIQ